MNSGSSITSAPDHFTAILYFAAAVVTALAAVAAVVIPLIVKAMHAARQSRDELRALAPLLHETRRNAAIAKEQTTNEHETNLRDDLDSIRTEFSAQLTGATHQLQQGLSLLATNMSGILDDVRNLRKEISDVRKDQHATDSRVDELTHPKGRP